MKPIDLRKLFVIILVVALCLSAAYFSLLSFQSQWLIKTAGWEAHASPFWSISFFNSNVGLVITSQEIRRTIDGGENWNTVYESEIDGLNSIFIVDEKLAWIVGSRGKETLLLRTNDQGLNWEKINLRNKASSDVISSFTKFFDICSDKFGKIYIVGDKGILEGFSNGLILEISNMFRTDEVLFSVSCNNSGQIWASGEKSGVYYYQNGWNKKSFDGNYLFGRIISEGNSIWVLGSDIKQEDNGSHKGVILLSKDNGKTWENRTPYSAKSLSDLFLKDGTGWLIGAEGKIYYSSDNGNSWIEQKSPTHNDLIKIFFFGSNYGWISGDKDTILKYQS